MNLLHMTKIPEKKQQLSGKYLLEGTRYIVQPLKGNRISLEVLDKNGHCLFGGCKITRSIGFLKRNRMVRL